MRSFPAAALVCLVLAAAPARAAEAGAPIAAVDQAARDARTARRHESARANPNIREAARVLGAEIDRIEEL